MTDKQGPDRFPGVVPVDPAVLEGMQVPEGHREPWAVAYDFLQLLEDPIGNRNALLALTTPESHAAWGDFTQVAAAYASIPDHGFGTMVDFAEGARDVCYFKIFSNMQEEAYYALEDVPVLVRALVTLVYRPVLGRWMVHWYGERMEPNAIPRG